MASIYTVKYNGQVYTVRGGDNASPEALKAYVGKQTPPEPKRTAAPPAPVKPMGAGEVATQAVKNIPSSALKLAEDTITPLLHPVETASNLISLGGGVLSKLGIGDFDESTADAVGGYLADRYGGVENIKKTLAEDPVGLVADLSTVFTGGGALAARAPGLAGKLGKAVVNVGNKIDPVLQAANATKAAAGTRIGQRALAPVKATGSAVATAATYLPAVFSGATTTSIKRAFTPNTKKGAAVERHMRGKASPDEPLIAAREAFQNFKKERDANYVRDIAPITSDPTHLDMVRLKQALRDAEKYGSYEGIDINEGAAKVWEDIHAKVKEFENLPPDKGRTVQAFDKLKQAIYNIGASKAKDNPAAAAVGTKARGVVLDEIKQQAPDYAKVMADYHTASDVMDDMEHTLSLGGDAAKDTAMRKLQTTARNNAYTNYGRRTTLLDLLGKYGAEDVPYMLAGQELSSATPRGLSRLGAEGVGVVGMFNPMALPALLATSPRLIGEAARKGSKLPALVAKYSKPGTATPRTLTQLGRGDRGIAEQKYNKVMAEYLRPGKSPNYNNPYLLLPSDRIRPLASKRGIVDLEDLPPAEPQVAEPPPDLGEQ